MISLTVTRSLAAMLLATDRCPTGDVRLSRDAGSKWQLQPCLSESLASKVFTLGATDSLVAIGMHDGRLWLLMLNGKTGWERTTPLPAMPGTS